MPSIFFIWSIIIITIRVYLFANIYIRHENKKKEFYSLMFLFVFSILLLASGRNLLTLLIGWDGLGLSSFFLVVFYKTSNPLSAGFITFLTNRLGDGFILITLVGLSYLPS